jgi:hypothetical protein
MQTRLQMKIKTKALFGRRMLRVFVTHAYKHARTHNSKNMNFIDLQNTQK